MVPLSAVARVEPRVVSSEINHYNQMRSVTVMTRLKEEFSMGEAVTFLENLGKRVLPSDFRADFSGETRQFLESQKTLYLIFGLALMFIYLVMAAQFESFLYPFIIMLSVPLSLTGALVGLWLSGGTLNIFSEIGLVTLIGLITKHGILLVDFANKKQDEGLGARDAILEAARLRLRPILMTTAAMVLGAVPLAIATGAGAAGRQQIGVVIVGGMTLGTLLTLFVVPVIYLILASGRKKIVHE
jgi:multidrug efflux pump